MENVFSDWLLFPECSENRFKLRIESSHMFSEYFGNIESGLKTCQFFDWLTSNNIGTRH